MPGKIIYKTKPLVYVLPKECLYRMQKTLNAVTNCIMVQNTKKNRKVLNIKPNNPLYLPIQHFDGYNTVVQIKYFTDYT